MKGFTSLRLRLTVMVAAVFAVMVTFVSIMVLEVADDRMMANAQANAEAVLNSYLGSDTFLGGTASVGVVHPIDSTRFFYRDATGTELSESEYLVATIEASLESISSATPPLAVIGVEDLFPLVPPGDESPIPPILQVDQQTGEVSSGDGNILTFAAAAFVPVGEVEVVDVGQGLMGVAQTLRSPGGQTMQVGVSTPLAPVHQSLSTIRLLLWLAVPPLVLVIGAMTWVATTRSLAPVHEITRHAQAITAANIHQRLPVPVAADEISNLVVTMNQMLERLDRFQRRQKQFVSDASHELRSPVAASTAQLEVVISAARSRNTMTNDGAGDSTGGMTMADPVNWIRTAEVVLNEQRRLSELIDDLLALSRIDEAGLGSTSEVDLDELIVAEAARTHRVAVVSRINWPVRVIGDERLLARAIRNLVDNAARHASDRVEITLDMAPGQPESASRATQIDSGVSSAIIQVDDDGPGVKQDQRSTIFDRFYRVDQARDRNSGGAGLGLSIVKEVVASHRGQVHVGDSRLGGARFVVRLPLDPLGIERGGPSD